MRRNLGKKEEESHTELVRSIIDYLRVRNIWAEKYHTGVWRGVSGKPVRSCPTGHPDIKARIKPRTPGYSGRVIWIEAKVGKDKLSTAQREWKVRAEKYGDVFIEARELGDVMALFERVKK